ncbi:Transpos assoc domain-containing protein [Abeliophyllum distichum]|uniref:Transpos assoc domain-containing protein n=1 Tax=Abeliophyllum distichum TaxID=126358 RepID=A0ABD1RTE5_9LAMI
MELAKLCLDENNEVRCPCRNCQNAFFQSLDVVESHLYLSGISASYERWIFHGEELDIDKEGNETNTSELEEEENDDEMNTMLEDLCTSMSFENHQPQDEEEDGMNHNSLPQMHNKDSNKFVGMLNKAQ